MGLTLLFDQRLIQQLQTSPRDYFGLFPTGMKSIADVNNARSAVSESQKIVEKILEVQYYVSFDDTQTTHE